MTAQRDPARYGFLLAVAVLDLLAGVLLLVLSVHQRSVLLLIGGGLLVVGGVGLIVRAFPRWRRERSRLD
jgi:uncharacterized membrane protein HdeD (DUF308 family)